MDPLQLWDRGWVPLLGFPRRQLFGSSALNIGDCLGVVDPRRGVGPFGLRLCRLGMALAPVASR
jgi:hypothetical protein